MEKYGNEVCVECGSHKTEPAKNGGLTCRDCGHTWLPDD